MAQIRSDLPSISEYGRHRHKADQEVEQLIKAIRKDRVKAVELARIEIKNLSPAQQRNLGQLLAEQLRGQLPPNVLKALNQGITDPALLAGLARRLGNSVSQDPGARFGRAATPEAARNSASNPKLPQQALRWTQFVQRVTHVPGGQIQGRAGTAAPKGEGTTLLEFLAGKFVGKQGPGLRRPQLVSRGIKDLSPGQRTALMEATFGKALASELKKLGITDPLMLVKAGTLPADRATLAQGLNMPRGRLYALLVRAELLKIGPGRNGELGIRPEFLGPLKSAGIAMLGTLAALRGLSQEELAHLYRKLRIAAGGFKNAIKGGQIPVKRDLVHWARTAGRKRSDILLADSEEYHGAMTGEDAQELIQAWYLENLIWEALAEARRRLAEDRVRWEKEQRERERQQQEQDQKKGQEEDDADGAWVYDDVVPDLEYDDQRDDHLMCFWVTDYGGADLSAPTLRRMYVCVDPDSGAIIPQAIEKEELVPT